MTTRTKLADVKPVKCWAHYSDKLYPTASNVALNSEDVPCVLMTAATFAKMKRRIKELEETAELYKVAVRKLKART